MSKALITEAYLTDIADAIRAKNGSSDTYTPPQMAAAIADIPTGGDVDVEALSVTQNGTYTAPTGKAYSPVTVNVQPTLQSKTATQNGTVTPDTGYDGLSSVMVNVPASGGVNGEIAVSGGSVSSSGVTIVSQPAIDTNGMTANANSGLQFSMTVKVIFEFDLIINAGAASNIIWSFGGSNTDGGVYTISTSSFGLFAKSQRFSRSISLTAGVKYRMKMELAGTQALLYADGDLIATGSSPYVQYAMGRVMGGNIALLYNQSSHSEYNSSHVDNIQIRFEQVTA